MVHNRIALQLAQRGAKVYTTGGPQKEMEKCISSVTANSTISGKITHLQGKCGISLIWLNCFMLVKTLWVNVNIGSYGCFIFFPANVWNESELEGVFNYIKQHEGGTLDILINNSYGSNDDASTENSGTSEAGKPFWDQSPDKCWDNWIRSPRLKTRYICTLLASR